MAELHLTPREERAGVTILGCDLPARAEQELQYHTRTGALIRVDGATAGAFDAQHSEVRIPAGAVLTLEVENESLPTSGLPSGPGFSWWWLNLRKRQRPSLRAETTGPNVPAANFVPQPDAWPVIGHAHLDVAWLWTYDEAARKALRTFATAANLCESYPEFIFTQSQPQLYAFVQQADAQFFERVRTLARAGRFDPSVAAMWVESDCNLPSGESLLRQMLHAHEFCTREFGVVPEVAWLPDTFGFCNTLPMLLAHAGIRYFVTTKLEWNDTTVFEPKQFRWRSPDGSEVTAALMASYDGDVSSARTGAAKARNEPLVAGYGDGGGGVTTGMLEQARQRARWIRPLEWLRALAKETLPVHASELYLEYHRGVYTTHHDVKARNAAIERKLQWVEEALAWCVAIKAPRDMTAALSARVNDAWRVVLRNQFHDVLPGTSIGRVYDDVHEEYDEVEALLDAVSAGTRNILPRSAPVVPPARVAPVRIDDGAFVFDNGLIRAVVSPAGIVTELAAAGGANVVSSANVLTLYADRPSKWEAWNIDAGYAKRTRKPKAGPAAIRGGALTVPFAYGRSTFAMSISVAEGEPFLRVELACDWESRRTLLRVEHWLAVRSSEATFGTPHGTITRSALKTTPQERAQFEVPGQRFAFVHDERAGFAQLSLDTYGWNARALPKGGMHLGHSLLRSTTWPDPDADCGEHTIQYAFVPFIRARPGAMETAWSQFAGMPGVRLFTCGDRGVLVAAVKPALDGNGVIVRVRECDGEARTARIRSAGRLISVSACDGLEEPLADETLRTEGEHIVVQLGAFALRSLRVRF